MQFGEIIEPSTRAIITDEEDLIESSEKQRSKPKWKDSSKFPQNISSLIVAETPVVTEVLVNFFLPNKTVYSELESGEIKIYKTANDIYIVSYKFSSEFCYGEIIEILSEWIEKAVSIFAITTASLASYINPNVSEDKSAYLVRCLTSRDSNSFNYAKLETPNLISGLSAGIMSYRLQVGKSGSVFVVYVESVPYDSILCKPIFDLFVKFGVSSIKPLEIGLQIPVNNLYM